MSAPSTPLCRYRLRASLAAIFVVGAGFATAQNDSSLALPNLPALPPIAFFPPNAPAFGAPIPVAPPLVTPPGRYFYAPEPPAPEALADYANEYFYPALGTRLYLDTLSAKLRTRVEQFRATRASLVNELVGQLSALELADEPSRQRELATLAARQTPRIVALEAEAEQLREDIVSGGIFGASVDWNVERQWKLDPDKTFQNPLDKEGEFKVLRAYAYYQKGLIAEQRGMLREIATEQEQQVRAARQRATRRPGSTSPPEDPAVMFFSPETSRFLLPPNLPPDLITKIGTYNHDKSALKQELRLTVLESDRMWSGRRTDTFVTLADKQWPRIVELSDLAEDIRRDFAALPVRKPTPPPSIPATLMERIQNFNSEVESLTAELNEYVQLQSIPLIEAPESYSPDERRGWYQHLATARADTKKKALEEFQYSHREQYDELLLRRNAIRNDLAIVAQNHIDPKTGKPMTVEMLQRAFNASMQQFAAFGREEVIYKNYRTAMLMPGLSPEQRRLLFGTALVGLAQPLPNGELMPRGGGRFPR